MKDMILTALAKENGHLTRHQLWGKLFNGKNGQTEAQYWTAYYEAEQALVDDGAVERRRGRAGGIYRIDDQKSNGRTSSQGFAEDARLEKAAYQPALDALLSRWKEEAGYKSVFGAITSDQGRRKTGGRWTQPDIVICTVSDWIFSSRPEGEIRTIEVKRFESLDVLAVYEALSHKNQAHYAYLLVVGFPEKLDDSQQELYDRVYAVANQHGIGIITAGNVNDWETWAFEVDAMRSNADHAAIHQLVMNQLPKNVRDEFRTAIRSILVQV